MKQRTQHEEDISKQEKKPWFSYLILPMVLENRLAGTLEQRSDG
jgi:hypothetical protein